MRERNHWWDWLKLVACISMFIDHLRFVVPAWEPLCFTLGRIAMPLFAYIAAQNFMMSSDREKYLRRLAPFAIASEVPFVMLSGQHGNVLILFLLTFSAMHLGRIWPLIFAGICPYGWAGCAAISLFTQKPEKLSTFVGGAILNPFPLGVLSGVSALLPNEKISMDRAPLFGRDFALWFYPLHILALLMCRVAL